MSTKKLLLLVLLVVIVAPLGLGVAIHRLTADERAAKKEYMEKLRMEANRPLTPEELDAERVSDIERATKARQVAETKATNENLVLENCKKLGTIAFAAMSAKQQGYSRLWVINGLVQAYGTKEFNPAVPRVVDLAFTAENQDAMRFGRKVMGDCLVGKYGAREDMF